MHPAVSVIIFTALSGLGFGMMVFLGLGMLDVSGWVAFVFVAMSYALAGGGLLSSLFHLGHPERFLKAFSQWRSSWLSREGVLSMATMGIFGVYALLWIFMDNRIAALGYIAAFLSVWTIFSTSMIYAQMKSVPRWHSPTTSVLYLLYGFAGGALLTTQVVLAGWLMLALAVTQIVTWVIGDGAFAKAGSTMETATGLGFLGKVRLLEKPHSGTNYLMSEMIHVIGRKHILKLRIIALALGSLIPAVMLLALPSGYLLALVVIAIHLVGLFAQRWLFFAEAEHVVGLYYGQH
ncbi:MAG: dimethyl sulfoxide reductase anchor subunit [Rhodobacteraceae bacterium]|nr:dimethyl sulfoxide reductase anchor subunit [Paracoccaceae bacterium]